MEVRSHGVGRRARDISMSQKPAFDNHLVGQCTIPTLRHESVPSWRQEVITEVRGQGVRRRPLVVVQNPVHARTTSV